MTRITAQDLARILDQVIEHRAHSDYLPFLNAVHLDADSTHLHAVATDRFTFAVARAKAQPATDKHTVESWNRTVPAKAVKALRKLIKAEDSLTALVTITPDDDADGIAITFATDANSLTVQTTQGSFPAWRKLIAGTLAKQPTDHVVGLDSGYTARWEHAERNLRTWHTGPSSPVVFAGDDFIGLQMPTHPHEGKYDHDSVATAWATSLGNAEPVDPADILNAIEANPQHRDFVEDLLRRVTVSVEDMTHAVSTEDPRWYDLLNANIYAWIGYRLLRALNGASPALTQKTLRDIDEELEGGEFAEWAWQYAEEAGYDPQKWVDDHIQRRAEQQAKQKAAVLPGTPVPEGTTLSHAVPAASEPTTS